MDTTSNTSESSFRLLVPVASAAPLDAPSVELCGQYWAIADYPSITDAPPYTCISYSWGTDRTENVFEPGQLMSARTIPVIEAMINASQSSEHWAKALMCIPRNGPREEAALSAALKATQAIWIDALCVPSREPARAVCLREMGAIFSSATQVFAVLSESCSGLFHQIHNAGHLNPEDLLVLEADDWITRAWTYQEMANSRKTLFIAQQAASILVLGLDFLNVILKAMTDYAKTQDLEMSALAARFPRLDSFQEMIAEHRLAEYTRRSAFQVMSAVQRRTVEREDDRIYSVIGAITELPTSTLDHASCDPAEYFMRICESKGDFSFIYCVAQRSSVPGRSWRPVIGQARPVLSGYLPHGSGLSGRVISTHLQMDNQCCMKPGILNSSATKAIMHFLQVGNVSSCLSDLTDAILERLRQKGFSGYGGYVELEHGYFFPQSPGDRKGDIFVATCHDVHWTNGGPGLLLRSNGTEIYQFCDIGVFIGRFPQARETINVG